MCRICVQLSHEAHTAAQTGSFHAMESFVRPFAKFLQKKGESFKTKIECLCFPFTLIVSVRLTLLLFRSCNINYNNMFNHISWWRDFHVQSRKNVLLLWWLSLGATLCLFYNISWTWFWIQMLDDYIFHQHSSVKPDCLADLRVCGFSFGWSRTLLSERFHLSLDTEVEKMTSCFGFSTFVFSCMDRCRNRFCFGL